MKSTLEALDRDRVIVEYEDPPTAPIRYRQIVREKGLAKSAAPSAVRSGATPASPPAPPSAGSGTGSAPAPVLADFKRFLDQIAQHEGFNMRQHIEAFGSGERFYAIKDYAERTGWIVEQKVQMAKTGRYAKLLQLTPSGRSVLAAL